MAAKAKPTEGKARVRSKPASAPRPRSASADLDRLIHERVRLGMLSALAVNESLAFTELKQLLQVTDGNLSVHARKLEDAGYVDCRKSHDKRVPRTDYSLTIKGKAALDRYLAHMEAIIRSVKPGND